MRVTLIDTYSIQRKHEIFLPGDICIKPAALRDSHHPSDDVIQWVMGERLDYCVHSDWGNGCAMYLIHATDEQLVQFKLTFPEARL